MSSLFCLCSFLFGNAVVLYLLYNKIQFFQIKLKNNKKKIIKLTKKIICIFNYFLISGSKYSLENASPTIASAWSGVLSLLNTFLIISSKNL